MHRYIARRLLLAIPSLILVSLAVFSLTRLIPGDAVVAMVKDTGNLPKAQLDELRHLLGLDAPFGVQYLRWLKGIVTGNLGESFYTRQPVLNDLAKTLPVSIELLVIAMLVGGLIAIPLGIISAIRQDTGFDYVARFLAVMGLSLPNFWIGTMLIVYLGLFFRYLPPLGYSAVWEDPVRNLKQFYLAGIVEGLTVSAIMARMVRSAMLEVLRQDYIRTAWAKGLKERVIVVRHAIKNALIPVVTIMGNLVSTLIGATVVIETLFSLPGVGAMTYRAVEQRDYPQIQANIMVLSAFLILMNLVVDLTYAWLDPKIRYG